ncbi:diguanylate cyclase domain-containing protein [Photobacterium rosenbergii]|uniref:Diguanylate cyclase n=1 Tax=Photobacterium rosenbergii TaxID=294936 RepID=A0ABU3ZD83_9GAMM|nr:diguanylate cyclase [Photobacterium rosenbergii]MDV5168062.1 diguanylate cyclase [Photobacterium rosenbergii]
MPLSNSCLYWLGNDYPEPKYFENIGLVSCAEDIPDIWGGILCINIDDPKQQHQVLRSMFSQPKFWSWTVYVIHSDHYSACLCDGTFDEHTAYNNWLDINQRIQKLSSIDQIEPLTGWLGILRSRRVIPFKKLNFLGIYQYPIVDAFYPELYSTYRFVFTESKRDMLEPEALIDRIRVCKHCNSGHLNYVEVCPNCKSIDIDVQSSLHCFTCGHVGDQQLFLRRGKLECPNCLTQLRHIGVDYDRPLETHRCNSCSHRFVEPDTISHCLNCEKQSETAELVIQKIYRYKLGQLGEYVYQHGKLLQAPELSIKGKVDAGYFENILTWLNKVALRHGEEHLLLAMHLPGLEAYSNRYGDNKMFALLDQITFRLNGLFRDTDICCQYKQDVLLVLMPKTPMANLSVLQNKIKQLSELIEEDEFVMHVSALKIPDTAVNEGAAAWLANAIRDIYATR